MFLGIGQKKVKNSQQSAKQTHVPKLPGPRDVEPLDTFELAQSLTASVAYRAREFKAKFFRRISQGLQGEKKAKLDKPLVCVQGFCSPPGAFKPLLDHLTEAGENGKKAYYVKGGRFFEDSACQEPVASKELDPQTRVFRIIPENRLNSFEACADQLEGELKAIRTLTGQAEPDILAHSMGGLSVRRYLDKYQGKVGKLLMVGTPHQGSRNASFGRKILAHNVGWAMSIAGICPLAGPAIEMLNSLDGGKENNPFLAEMNERWPEQEKKTQGAITIGASEFSTPTFGAESRWGKGDAWVEKGELHLPGAKTKLLAGGGTKVHCTLAADRDVYREMHKFFGW